MKTYRIQASKRVNYDVTVKANSYEEAMENFEMNRWESVDEWDDDMDVLDCFEEEDDD